MIVNCKRKVTATALQWNGNIREMQDFLTQKFQFMMNDLNDGDYVVYEDESWKQSQIFSAEDFQDKFQIAKSNGKKQKKNN